MECFPYRREVAVTQVMGEKNSTKTFQFDKVFDGNARQEDIYLEVVVPIVEEVLTGYNCTIFAYAPAKQASSMRGVSNLDDNLSCLAFVLTSYGQTGTGKTHTMEGARIDESGVLDHPDAGIIPRTLQHLFQVRRPPPEHAASRLVRAKR